MRWFSINNKKDNKAHYSNNLPDGSYTNILNDYCISRITFLHNLEMNGRAGIPIRQDDINECQGLITILLEQKIREIAGEKVKMQKEIDIITDQLSRPMTFEIEKEKKPSILQEFSKLKKNFFILKGVNHEKE